MATPYQQHSLLRGPQFKSFLGDRRRTLEPAMLWNLGLLRPAVMDGPLPEQMDPRGVVRLETSSEDHDRFVDVSLPATSQEEIWERLERRNEAFRHYLNNAWYHPFQIWQAHKIHRHLTQAPVSVFFSTERYRELTESERSSALRSAVRWAGEWDFVDSFRLTSFVIQVAPVVMFRISGRVVSNRFAGESSESYWDWRRQQDPVMLMREWGVAESDLRRWHGELAINAYRIDPISSWFDLVQQISWDKRGRARNEVLLAHDLYVMAQIIRHYAADFLDIDLPEEDEVWHGPYARAVKQNLYDTPTVTLVSRETRRRIAREFGVTGDERLVWYVEGETEVGFIQRYGQLRGIEPDATGITIVDLKGEGGLKHISARLKVDRREERFTYVVVDRDHEKGGGKKTLRQLCSEESNEGALITAGYTMWDGDVESANFTDSELAAVVRRLATERGVPDLTIDGACISRSRAEGVSSEKAINQCLRGQHYQLPKGRRWGELLAEWARDNRCPAEKAVDGERPVVALFWTCIRNSFADYLGSVKEYRVDPETGEIVKR